MASNEGFYSRRIVVYVIVSLLFSLVFFQRMCPSVVAEKMAITYGIPKSELGVFSSIFFYPYAFMQPFAGLLADIMEPAYLIGTAHIIAAIGAVIIGFSTNLTVGSIGRFLVGLGCGPTYVPIVRVLTNWFKHEQLATMLGVLLAIGGLGSLFAQGPLAAFSDAYGWENAFFGIAGIGLLFSLLCFFFVRGSPEAFNFIPPNKELSHTPTDSTISQKMDLLWTNFKQVISLGQFWIVVAYNIFSSGPYFDIGGLWAGPYLRDVHGYSTQESGNLLIATSIGMICGSLVVPSFSTWIRSRKWVLFGASVISFFTVLSFTIWGSKISRTMIFVFFLLIGAFTNSMTSVAYPMIREFYHPSVAATSVGCANIFTFLSSAFFQTFTSSIIPTFGTQGVSSFSTVKYTEKGYHIILWLFCTISLFISLIVIMFSKDTLYIPEDKSDDHSPEVVPVKPKEQTGEDLDEL